MTRHTLAFLIAVALVACGGSQKAGAGGKSPSYATFHSGYKPIDQLVDPSNQAVQVTNAMTPQEAARIMAEYLKSGDTPIYIKLICSVPRKHAGAIVDALPADLQSKGIDVISPPACALDVLYYVSEGTYGNISEQLAVLGAFGRPTSDPAALARVAGVYPCRTMNNKPLPYVYPNRFALEKAIFTFNADGTYSNDASGSMDGTVVPMKATGTFTVVGDKIEVLRDGKRSTMTIAADGSLVTVTDGISVVYEKQP